MSIRNKVGRNIESEISEIESTSDMKLDEIKYNHMKTINYLEIKVSSTTPSNIYSSSEQTSAYPIKCPTLRSPEKSLHASQFNKQLSSLNLEGNTKLQIF